MNQNELEILVNEFKMKLNKSPPDFNLFLTEPGKKFQTEIVDLMGFISIGNIIPALPGILSTILESVKNRINTNLDFDVLIIPKKNNSILHEQNLKIDDILDDFNRSVSISKEVTLMISRFIARLNSYYFLALFAYIDHYVNSLYKLILSNYSKEDCIDLFDSFRPKGKPKEILLKIKEKMDLGEITKINQLPDGEPWWESFSSLLNIRHKFAHKEPIARKELLYKNFKRISDNVIKDIKSLFVNNLSNQNIENELISEIQNILKPNFESLIILVQIGKECIGYLAIYDNLISEYFRKNIPL